MKGGAGIGLAIPYFIIAIIIIISIFAFYGTSLRAYGSTCKQDALDKMTNWVYKMGLPGASTFDDTFQVRDCVEFVDREGIKFKSEEKKRLFSITDCDPYQTRPDSPGYCQASERVKFQFSNADKILPVDVPQKVRITPPATIEFVGR